MKLAPVHMLCLAILLLGCANAPPELEPLSDTRAFVGRELSLSLSAADENGDPLTFSFSSDSAAIDSQARLSETGSNRRLFRWTPLASDVGEHVFDFRVSDGIDEVEQTIAITVLSAGDGSTSPVFVQPLGTGTQLDVDSTPCIDVPIVVNDDDSASVTILQELPLIEGSTLVQETEFAATWSWCPTQQQIAASDRYTLVLSADDGQGPRTIKNYLLVLDGTGVGSATTPLGGTCMDDGAEDDDGPTQARDANLAYGAYSSADNAICSGDDDWYAVYLNAGETVHASLVFDQLDVAQDLDLHFYQGDQPLTNCTEGAPAGCDPNNGQSGTSDEYLQWTAASSGTYYVVVHGWNGSENHYDLCIGLSSGDCL